MRIILLTLTIFLSPLLLSSQQQKVQFIMKDSTVMEYTVPDIDSLTVKAGGDSLKWLFHNSISGGIDTIDVTKILKILFADSTRMAFVFEDTTIYEDIDRVDSASFVESKPPGAGTVTIGSQVWMGRNLDVTTYRNGDPIPCVNDPAEWEKLTTGAWCYYDSSVANGAVYGKLYNWYAVNDSRGLAPEGWHIPNSTEWAFLGVFLGGDSLAGGKMKEPGTTHWKEPNTGADNSSGFTALPGGIRNYDGAYTLLGSSAAWWVSTGYDELFSFGIYLMYDSSSAKSAVFRKSDGFSVRCIKD